MEPAITRLYFTHKSVHEYACVGVNNTTDAPFVLEHMKNPKSYSYLEACGAKVLVVPVDRKFYDDVAKYGHSALLFPAIDAIKAGPDTDAPPAQQELRELLASTKVSLDTTKEMLAAVIIEMGASQKKTATLKAALITAEQALTAANVELKATKEQELQSNQFICDIVIQWIEENPPNIHPFESYYEDFVKDQGSISGDLFKEGIRLAARRLATTEDGVVLVI